MGSNASPECDEIRKEQTSHEQGGVEHRLFSASASQPAAPGFDSWHFQDFMLLDVAGIDKRPCLH